ncbi:MAG: hypothetical protein DRO67_02205 [Candidatus Asgardarchaeum californiense]|nr:MAG: hypothetical protein DRO67_02205 [Candidatus Asgardarchaeum californiense]
MPIVGIFGGSGFVGSFIAKELISKDYKVKILDIREPPNEIRSNVEYISCDIRRFDEVKRCIRDVDVVVNAAIVQIPLINEQKRLGYEVNIVGTQNLCEAVESSPNVKGMLLVSSWHVIGESGINGVVDEGFGYRPDKVEDRARLYALSKTGQEVVVRFFDHMSSKVFGIIRIGTALGEGMPEKTAANMFIENALREKPLTPYAHSMYRPMIYVDVEDVAKAFRIYVEKILSGEINKTRYPESPIILVAYPEPITVLDLANIMKETVYKLSKGMLNPEIRIVNTGQKSLFTEKDKEKFKLDISKAKQVLRLGKLKHPKESIRRIVALRMRRLGLL